MSIYVINEAKEAPLYHCTTVRAAISILKSGELRPTVPYHDQTVPSNVSAKPCVCMTRSDRYVLDSTYYVQFVFDQGKLVNNYKIKSVANRRYNARGIDYGTADPENADNFESEERIMTDKPIPVGKYLLDIRIVPNDTSRSDITRMLKDGYYGDRDMYQLYTLARTSNLPLEGILNTIDRVRAELSRDGVRMDMKEPQEVTNPGTTLIPEMDFQYNSTFTRYTEDGEPVFAEKPSDFSSVIFFDPSIYSILTKEDKIPDLTLKQLKPHVKEVRLMDGQMDPERVANALKKIRDNNITDPFDAGKFAENSSEEFLLQDLIMITALDLPCSSVSAVKEPETKETTNAVPNTHAQEFGEAEPLVDDVAEDKVYHPDIVDIMSVTADKVIVKFKDGVVAEYKIALGNTVTGVIVRKPGKKAQVYGGTKAIPPYHKKIIASGVVMEIYNDMFQEEVVEPIDMEDDNVRFYVSFEGRDVVIEAEILVNNLVKYDLVRDYLVNVLGMDGDFVKRTTTISAPNRDLWIGRINSYFEQIQAKIDEYVPVVDEVRDTVGLLMQDLIKPKGFNVIEVSDDSINAEIEVGNAKITVDMDAHDADIYVAGIKLSDYPDLVADMDNAGYTNIREYTDDSIKIMESISEEEDIEEFANRISELLDMITNGVANAPAEAEEPEQEKIDSPDPEPVVQDEIIDDVDQFVNVMSNRRDFREEREDFMYKYNESDDNYDFMVQYDDEYDVVYFIVHCADKNDTEFINRVMGNAYKFSGYTGQSVMTVQMDLGDLNKMIDGQVKKFNILVDETLAQSQAKSAHAISAELVAKPQQDPEQERAAKRLEKFVRTVLAPIVDSDSNWNSFFIDTPKEFKRYRLRTVGIMLTCYDMKSSTTELKSNPLFKKMSKAKKVVIQRGWQKALDPDGNKCWMCIFIDAEYAKEHGRELLEEKVSYQGEDYMVIDIQDNLAILEGTDRLRVISTGTLLDL